MVDRVFQCHPCSAVARYEKRGVWRSDRPPQYFDLPCFCQHLYLYLNTPFHLNLRQRLKKNTHKMYQRLESNNGLEEWIFEIVWHWNDNSRSFSKRGDGSLYIDVAILYFYDQGLVLGHTFQSSRLCWHLIWSGWKDVSRFSLIAVWMNLLCVYWLTGLRWIPFFVHPLECLPLMK